MCEFELSPFVAGGIAKLVSSLATPFLYLAASSTEPHNRTLACPLAGCWLAAVVL